jgi:hypothetical protein
VVASASGQDAAAASDAGLVSVSKIDPGQVSQAILSITGETSGNPRLVESNLDAAVHKAVGPGPLGGPFAVFDGRELIVAAGADSRPHASGLAIATTSGSLKRTLTFPQADVTDTDPAVTASGEVYFLRTATHWSGQNGGPLSTTLMEIPLSGARPAVRVRTADPPIFSTLSALTVNAKGTLLAARCQPPGNGGWPEACVYDLPSGRIRYVTDFGGSAPSPKSLSRRTANTWRTPTAPLTPTAVSRSTSGTWPRARRSGCRPCRASASSQAGSPGRLCRAFCSVTRRP